MKRLRPATKLALTAIALSLIQVQCLLIPDDTQKGDRVENKRPTVRITAGAATSDQAGIDYKVLFRWNGFDEDGVIAQYQYAIDDTISENAWRDTTGFSALVKFRAATQDTRDASNSRFTDWHTFYVRAVDNELFASPPDHRFFNARTIAPTAELTFPTIASEAPEWQRTIIFRWDGEDLDSSDPDRKPVAYEYKLVEVGSIVGIPDSWFVDSLRIADNLLLDTLRVGSKAGWIRRPATDRQLRLDNLPVNAQLVFGVRAIDEAGAVEPELSKGRNYVAFGVSGQPGVPIVNMTETASAGFFQFGSETWTISAPTGIPIRFKWVGDASHYGSEPGNVNYAIDIPDVEDETLTDPNGIGGWIGWGRWTELQRPIIFTPQDGGTEHHFWLKMRDISDAAESERLCHVIIQVVGFTFERHALIVDDSRFANVPNDVMHDEFMDRSLLRRIYELGPVDKFSAYSGAQENPAVRDEALPLSLLAKYRNVIWHQHANGQDKPLAIHEVEKKKLSSYLGAGGRMFLAGDQFVAALKGTRLGDYGYPKNHPDEDPPGYPRDSFIWNFLKIRNRVVSRPNPGDAPEREATGMIGARSLHPAYPDLRLDHSKHNPYDLLNNETQFRSGIGDWEGVRGVYVPIERMDGLDSLYTVVTFDTTYCCGKRDSGLTDAVIAQRYESTRIDTLRGTPQGRTILFDFQPWYFEEAGVLDAGTSAINWLVTGKDH
jgi:hypothetical protein